MRLNNSDISYSREMLEKHLSDIRKVDLEEYAFSEGICGKVGNRELWYGKMPSGRYVFLCCWASYSLRQFI
jgi:hypothetical protein